MSTQDIRPNKSRETRKSGNELRGRFVKDCGGNTNSAVLTPEHLRIAKPARHESFKKTAA